MDKLRETVRTIAFVKFFTALRANEPKLISEFTDCFISAVQESTHTLRLLDTWFEKIKIEPLDFDPKDAELLRRADDVSEQLVLDAKLARQPFCW